VQTFEGHDASVLKLEFLTSGTQIFSCGGDGLLKLWTIKNNECSLTLDGHEGRIWALAGTVLDINFKVVFHCRKMFQLNLTRQI